ncbi:Endoglucanase-4 [Drechslerella dactyloides]|uniref:AA9 family lytic polysaccharide monooxygenase n=1 Tax=Drechslerella dactyloides TaxID=74499 RepID=A0AAD6J390_DREDA|nr:Endoglucanase-4 [Drechslerella dactyloides]
MKISVPLTALGLVAYASAHAIMQRVSVNGADQGLLNGIRAPRDNNPFGDVNSQDIICDANGSTSSVVIPVAPGDRLGFQWQHIIGGPQGSNDPDNPIAASHKGPIQVYLAKVGDAATAAKTGLSWFKVASEGLSGGKWGVDTMIQGNGWWYFNLPTCLAPGDYLARVELIALHSAYSSQGVQFYISCAQLRVSGSGSWTGSGFVNFPGAYSQNDPGIQINIYGSSGGPDNGGRPYTAPGGPVQQQTCGGGGQPTTTARTTTTRTTTAQTTIRTTTTSRTTTPATRTTTTPSTGGGGQTLYGQCGGVGWTGPTNCAQGTCKELNAYYSQCLN